MDIAIIFLVTSALIGTALVLFKSYTLFSIWRSVKGFGLNAGLHDTIALSKFYEIDESFVRVCGAFKKLDPKIPIRQIVNHHMANGDTEQLLDKWSELKKRKLCLSFEAAVILDLSGRDIVQVASQNEQVFKIALDQTFDGAYYVEYHVEFKIPKESVAWITPNIEDYQMAISENIGVFLIKQRHANLNMLRNDILQKVLDKNFWKELCHGEVIQQELSILKR